MTHESPYPLEGGEYRLVNGRLIREGDAAVADAPLTPDEPGSNEPESTESTVSPAPVIKPSRDRKDY